MSRQNTMSTYPKLGDPGNERLDACEDAVADLARRADALMARHGRRDDHDIEIAEEARENTAGDRSDASLTEPEARPDNTLTTPGHASRMDSKEKLNAALSHKDPAWGYFHVLKPEDRKEMDRLLVEMKHPLVYEAGTNENRFRQLHRSGFRFDTLTTPGQGRADESEEEREEARGKLNKTEERVANPHVEARENKPDEVYLRPETKSYPVKVKREGRWEYDRGLLLAAERDANMHGEHEIASRAKRLLELRFGTGEGEKKDAQARTDPPVSEAQRRFMRWAAEHPGEAGVSRKVSEEFNEADPGGKLPARKSA